MTIDEVISIRMDEYDLYIGHIAIDWIPPFSPR
jgi:hypothetical protein